MLLCVAGVSMSCVVVGVAADIVAVAVAFYAGIAVLRLLVVAMMSSFVLCSY